MFYLILTKKEVSGLTLKLTKTRCKVNTWRANSFSIPSFIIARMNLIREVWVTILEGYRFLCPIMPGNSWILIRKYCRVRMFSWHKLDESKILQLEKWFGHAGCSTRFQILPSPLCSERLVLFHLKLVCKQTRPWSRSPLVTLDMPNQACKYSAVCECLFYQTLPYPVGHPRELLLLGGGKPNACGVSDVDWWSIERCIVIMGASHSINSSTWENF